jgi:replicative DNA helicase
MFFSPLYLNISSWYTHSKIHPFQFKDFSFMSMPDTTLPHSLETEQALLSAIMLDNKSYEDVSDLLKPDHFYHPAHQSIYTACQSLIDNNQLANPLTLKVYFDASQSIESIGGNDYLTTIATAASSILYIKQFAQIIFDTYLKRQLIYLGKDVAHTAQESDMEHTGQSQIEDVEQKLFDLSTIGTTGTLAQSMAEIVPNALEMAESAYRRDGSLMGLSSGFKDLDESLGGLSPSDLIILAGRPSMGKTAVSTGLAYNVAHIYQQAVDKNLSAGRPVLFFSLEMSSEQLATRLISSVSGVASDGIRRGDITDVQFQNVAQASQDLKNLPFYIDDTPALTIGSLRTRARRLKRQQDIGLIVVDYLQLLNVDQRSRNDNRVQEISTITRNLKAIAKELNLPVIALSQLSRAVEQREDKRPQLSDLRESGSIEQDADIVMFLFRQHYYLSRGEPMQRSDEAPDKFALRRTQWEEQMRSSDGITEIIIAKHRHGPVGTVRLYFDSQKTRFTDLEQRYDTQAIA